GASFAVQEEVGERGVLVNASRLQPDVMICFEGCPADDTFSEDYMVQAALGKGPMLRNMDVSMITNWRFQKFAVDLAKQCGIPVQQSVRAGGGTNAAAVNSRFGTPAIVIGIPVRYIHSPNCFVDERDYENAVKLAVALVHALTASNVGKL
ncbi:MAG: M42 family peptidase, partial [Galactobacillus timonensis]|nr:M42 family peptidase [Galactobacillus timonensis]